MSGISTGLNCEAKPAPPRVVVSRWPWKRALLPGRGDREEVEEPPRRRSSVVVQGGGRNDLYLSRCHDVTGLLDGLLGGAEENEGGY